MPVSSGKKNIFGEVFTLPVISCVYTFDLLQSFESLADCKGRC